MSKPPSDPTDMHAQLMALIKSGLVIDKKDRPISCFTNAVAYIVDDQERYRLAYDAFRNEITLDGAPLTERDYGRIHQAIERHYNQKYGKTDCIDAVEYVAMANQSDALLDFIASLQWDQKPRLSTWTQHAFPSREVAKYESTIGTLWMRAAIARAIKPGCQVDNVLVLIGRQGVRKSSALRELFGGFHVELVGGIHGKEPCELLPGTWCMELSELSATRKADIESLKGFLTRTVDKYRPPYARIARALPRRCIFAATTNKDDALPHDDEHRRFWPIRGINERVDIEWIRDNRLQLFAEAKAHLEAGAIWYAESIPGLDEAQSQLSARSPLFDVIAEYVTVAPYPAEGYAVTDIYRDMGLNSDQIPRVANYINQALIQLGYVKSRKMVGGIRLVRYEKP